MPDGRAELELIIEVAQQQLKKLDGVRKSITDLDEAAENLDAQDLDLDTAGLDKAQQELKETVRDTKALIKEGDRLEREFGSAVRALEKASKRINFDPASKSAQRLRAEVDRAGRALLEFGSRAPKALNATERELRDVEKAAKRARGEFRKFQDTAKPGRFQKLVSTFRDLKVAVGAFLGAIVIRRLAELGAAAVDAALDLGRLENALNAIEGVNADEVLERVRSRANALGVDLRELENLTSAFVNTALRVGLTLEEALAVIEGFSTASVGAGKSQEELARALRQVEQGLAKGKFEMQDLKIIMEVIPGVTSALSRGLGITTERLFELQKKGLIPAKEATIILAAELPKLFGKAVQANAQDFRAEVQRVRNEIFELGRDIGQEIIPELEEWLAIFKELGSTGPEQVGLITGAITAVSDRLQLLVRLTTSFVRLDWKQLWAEAQVIFEGFTIFMTRTGLKGFEALAGGIEKIFPGFRAQLDDTLKRLEEWEKEAKERADAVAEGFIAGDEKTIASSKSTTEQLAEEQKSREALALKAREDALAKIAAAEKKSLKKRKDAFDSFFASTSGGTQTVGVETTGAAQASDELARINSLLQTIGSLEIKELTGITQKELDLLNAARRELMQINATGLGDIQGELSGISDVTDQARAKLSELAGIITAGESRFDSLGDAAQSNIGLIVSEFERLVERGGVSTGELNTFLAELEKKLSDSGIAGQTAAGQILDYTNAQQNAANVARDLAETTGAAGQAIREVKDEAGDVIGFTNLKEGAEAAAGAVEILRGNEADLRDTISNTKDETIDAAAAIKLLEDETGKVTISNVGDQAEEAAEGLSTLTGDLKPAADGLGETAGKAKDLDTNLAAVSVTVEKLPGQISAALGVVTENADALSTAQTVTDALAISLPLIGQGLTAAQAAIAPLAVDVPKLLVAINDAKEKGSFEAVKELAAQLAEKMPVAAKALKSAQEGLEGLLTAAASEDAEKLKTLIGDFASDDNLERLGQLKTLFSDTATSIKDTETDLSTLIEKANEAAGDSGAFADLEARLQNLIDILNDRLELAISNSVGLLDELKLKVEGIAEKVEELSKLAEERMPTAFEAGAARSLAALGPLERKLNSILQQLAELESKG